VNALGDLALFKVIKFSVDFILCNVLNLSIDLILDVSITKDLTFVSYKSFNFWILAWLMWRVTVAALSEHLFKGRVIVLFCRILNDTTPAIIFPLAVLMDIIKSTFIHSKVP